CRRQIPGDLRRQGRQLPARQQQLQAEPAQGHSSRTVLVGDRLRSRHRLRPGQWPAVPLAQHDGHAGGQCRRVDRHLFRPDLAGRRQELAADDSRPGLLRDPAHLWAEAGFLRQDLEAGRHREAAMRSSVAIGPAANFSVSRGSLTIYVQADPPPEAQRGNWLPAPKGADFSLYMRSYWPKVEITDGSWTPPAGVRSN